jgi:hypothetical protein
MWCPPPPSAFVAIAAVLLLAPLARAGGDREPRVVGSVFFIAKSENKNQVHYGIHLDAGCAPASDAPVFAYWRMLERGPLVTEPLLSRETAAYGLASQSVQRTGSGGRVVVILSALPRRPIVVESAVATDGCAAGAHTAIGGVPASLGSVYLQLRWPFGVDYLMLAGRSSADGRLLHERIAP